MSNVTRHMSKVVVYDSGIGGRAVFDLLQQDKDFSQLNFLRYFSDDQNFPYGTKTVDELHQIIFHNLKQFESEGVGTVCVACNTASIIIDQFSLANEFPSMNIFTIVEPTLVALTNISNPNVHILASQFTVNSNVYVNAIQDLEITDQITQSPEQLLISYIENKAWEDAQHEVERIIKNLDPAVDLLILACTHFSIIKKLFEQELITQDKKIKIIDSSEELAKETLRIEDRSPSTGSGLN